ncbi:MAG: ABC transporter ATP-binding protein [Desulfomonilaceae bacterium]
MNPLIKVKNLNVFYGYAQALWDVSFKVEEGQIFSIIGSNGAGKSTILRTISGLQRPFSGEVEFGGARIEGESTPDIVNQGISLVPEGRGLFTRLTALENLELGAFTKRARPLARETLEQVMELFPIVRKRRHQITGKLSGGEQQMVAIGRALMARPKLLMLDEPSLGLAPIVVKMVFEIISSLKRQGVTILLVEQNIHQALKIADRACVIKTGRVTRAGTGYELLIDPEIKKAYMGTLL